MPTDPTREALYRCHLGDWRPEENLLQDEFGPVAAWDFSISLPKTAKAKDGGLSIFAMSDRAFHLTYTSKLGLMKTAPANLTIDWKDVAEVRFREFDAQSITYVMLLGDSGDELVRLVFHDYPGLVGPTVGRAQVARIEPLLPILLG
jgi:hypothetical protein